MRIFINVRNSIRKILREEIEKNPNYSILNKMIVFNSQTTKEDIKKVLNIFKDFGVPTPDRDREWTDEDIDVVMQDFIKRGRELALIPSNDKNEFTGLANDGTIIYWGNPADFMNHDVTRISYGDFISTIYGFDINDAFDKLYESKENEFDWVNDLKGEKFGEEVSYSYLRPGDEIFFTTDNDFRVCGFPNEVEKGKIIKTIGTRFLVLTDNITFCGPNLRKWSDGSNTMLDGLKKICKDYSGDRYHNCVEIARNTRSKYYMVKTREELTEGVEDDDFDWAKQLAQSEMVLKHVWEYLEPGDQINLSGDIQNDENDILLTLNNEPFEVGRHYDDGFRLFWLNDVNRRPDGWESISYSSGGQKESIEVNVHKFPSDAELIVNNFKKSDYPF